MCGIVGYTGGQQASSIIIEGLRKLEYRGYDSAGICTMHNGKVFKVRSEGKLVNLERLLRAIRLGRSRGSMSREQGRELIAALVRVPGLIEETLKLNDKVEKVAHDYLAARDFLYLGRGLNYPIALEGALKLKEISYIHAEGYPAGEMKHGPIALIDGQLPVVVLVPKGANYEKVCSNMEEVIARGGRVIAVCTEGDREVRDKVEVALEIPAGGEVSPIILAIPMQLLA